MPTYLDYAASTPLDPEVLAAMTEAAAAIGNPSATHSFGRAARLAVDAARREAAIFLAVHEDEVAFTSGATEANNLAILGFWHTLTAEQRVGARLLVSPLEHASVLEAIRSLEHEGAIVDWMTVDSRAIVAADLTGLLRPETVLVACQWVNNVFGTVQPVAAIGEAVVTERSRRGATGLPLRFHVDAVQAARFLSLQPAAAGIDSLSLSAHKFYGPKGVGCLWVRRGASLMPLALGGGQESGRRAGTENVMSIVACGAAMRLAAVRRDEERRQNAGLEEIFWDRVRAALLDVTAVGDRTKAVPGLLALRYGRNSADQLAMLLDADGFAVSTGSACDAGKREASRGARAVLGEQAARRGFLRISFGRGTAAADLTALVEAFRRH